MNESMNSRQEREARRGREESKEKKESARIQDVKKEWRRKGRTGQEKGRN